MKKKFFLPFTFCLVLSLFGFGYYCGLKKDKISHFFKTGEWKRPRPEYNLAFKPEAVKWHHSFVVLVASYNNAKFCKKNIESILTQDYPFYRVIYVDDASMDGTFDEVKSLVEASPHKEKFTLIRNDVNQGAMANIYRGVHSCKDSEIITILDGDDSFASPFVLSSLNAYYNNPNVWMTYGQCIHYPSYRIGPSCQVEVKDLKNPALRKMTWRTSHLRTFYAGLFKKIAIEDLMYEGKFLGAACDLATMLPMVEMAREHAFFIPEILYIYNEENPLMDCKVNREKQLFYDKYIRSKPCYDKIEALNIL